MKSLAENCTYLEVAYLLLHGELPTASELAGWSDEIRLHTMVHENIKKFMDGFLYDAHPMGMLVSTVAALSTFYPDAKNISSRANRRKQQLRLIGKMPTLAAYAYRHSLGLPYAYPDNDLSYTENFMNMLWKKTEPRYKSSPVLAKALDVLFILHADHEQNCSTSTMRTVASSEADPYVVHRGRGRALLRAAARRRQRGCAGDARRDRFGGEDPGVHQRSQGRRAAADGLRPSRVQELRSARQNHQAASPTRFSR